MTPKTNKGKRMTLLLITLTAAIYVGSAGSPPLLDDADSLYAEVAREMNVRGDWVTPYVNSIRYLEKPPLFYWLISLSYAVFGAANAFTARLPTALATVALVFVTFKIGELLFGFRAGLLGGLALATSLGMFLFTRIILPDALFSLLLALALYSFLRWERAEEKTGALLWLYALAGLAVLAKGLIGMVFPGAIALATLAATGRIKEAPRLLSLKGILVFLAIAVPWHILVGERNPGFYWFYFVNEHFLRFLGKRYPQDYGTIPLAPFWLLHLVWLFPWSLYLSTLCWPSNFKRAWAEHGRKLALPLAWALVILLFFSFSSRLEYYTLPALPGLALLAGAQCASFWELGGKRPGFALAVVGALVGILCIAIAAFVSAGATGGFSGLTSDPDLYRYYFGHLLDLAPERLRELRLPLAVAGLGLGVMFPLHYLIKRAEAKAAVLALGMGLFFVAANVAFLTFIPRMTSKPLAAELNRQIDARSTIIIDGEYAEASSAAFYTRQTVLLLNGRMTTLEYGSYYPDAPPVFIDSDKLRQLWSEPDRRVFFITKREQPDSLLPQTNFVIARYGDKILLSNRPNR
jgi:4-amino-4-deoxy-L-arabinose transferase-like glycosyltransferase